MTISDAPDRSDPDRLSAIMDFLFLLDSFKTIERRGYIADGSRRETDAEHCWHLAMYVLLLHREVGFEVDLGHTLILALVHDLVEIHAGDTYAYDDAGRLDQDARERAAAERLFGMLPSDIGARLMGWWREFEDGVTPEARFAKALDRLQGFAQNLVSGGRAWREHGIGRERTHGRTDLTRATDPVLAMLIDRLYARADAERMWPEKAPA